MSPLSRRPQSKRRHERIMSLRRLCRRNTSKRRGAIRACWRPQITADRRWRLQRNPACFMDRVSSRRALPAGTPTRMRQTRTRTAHRARGRTTRRAQTRTSRIRRAGRMQIQTRPAAISRTRNLPTRRDRTISLPVHPSRQSRVIQKIRMNTKAPASLAGAA